MKTHLLAALAVSLLFTGCATTNSYVGPSSGATATVAGQSKRKGLVDWEFYSLHSIDSKTVSTFWGGAGTQVALAPGAHVIVVHAMYNRSLGGACPCETYVELPVEVAPTSYILNGQVEGGRIRVWLESAETKQRASEISQAGYRSAPRDTFVPIFISK